ncbi:MAG: general secretion pathway protein GspK [Kiritimatiellales bacterium]
MRAEATDPRSGSALLIVLGVIAILAVLVAGFGRGLKADLSATSGFYDEVRNTELARSALAAAEIELSNDGTMYADVLGNVYFVTEEEDYESEIEEKMLCRQGIQLGRGMFSYRIIMKPYALGINELSSGAWERFFELACGMDEGDERSALVDAILDWRDADNNARDSGAEEDFYQELDPPRHCRNDDFETVEELLLVNGMTPDLLFGYGMSVAVDGGLMTGGGLYRYIIGDNSPEAQASAGYILRGVLPADDPRGDEEEEGLEPGEFEKVEVMPSVLYVVAEGFVSGGLTDDELGESTEPVPDDSASRHIILVKLALPDSAQAMDYQVEDFQENAAGELLDRVLAYGVPEEDDEL